jgi:hypothetical protein
MAAWLSLLLALPFAVVLKTEMPMIVATFGLF